MPGDARFSFILMCTWILPILGYLVSLYPGLTLVLLCRAVPQRGLCCAPFFTTVWPSGPSQEDLVNENGAA